MRKRISLVAVVVMIMLLVGCGKTYQKEYDLGVRYLSEGNYEEAVIAFTAAIEIEPNHAEAYVGLADTYIGMSDLVQARDVLAGGLEVVDDETELRRKLSDVECGMGQVELEQGNYADAIDHYLEALKNDPESENTYELLADAYIGLGDEYLETGEYEKAEEAFQNAIDNDPDQPDAYEGLADAYIGQGDKEKAIEILKEGIKTASDIDALKSKLSDVEYDYGVEKSIAGEYEEAIELLQDSLNNNPDQEDAHSELAFAYFCLANESMGEDNGIESIEKAIDFLNLALAEDADLEIAENMLLELQSMLEWFEAAIPAYEEELEKEIQDARAALGG